MAADQPLLELETDKATFELPSPQAGTVRRVHVKKGDTVRVGQKVLTIEAGRAAGDGREAEKDAKDDAAAPPPRHAGRSLTTRSASRLSAAAARHRTRPAPASGQRAADALPERGRDDRGRRTASREGTGLGPREGRGRGRRPREKNGRARAPDRRPSGEGSQAGGRDRAPAEGNRDLGRGGGGRAGGAPSRPRVEGGPRPHPRDGVRWPDHARGRAGVRGGPRARRADRRPGPPRQPRRTSDGGRWSAGRSPPSRRPPHGICRPRGARFPM